MTAANLDTFQIVTFGYGNESDPEQRLLSLINEYKIKAVVDTRDEPNKARLGSWRDSYLHQWFSISKSSYDFHSPCGYFPEIALGNIPVAMEMSEPENLVRMLPWNRDPTWYRAIGRVTGELYIHNSIALMCCEGEPFTVMPKTRQNPRYFKIDKPRCHRVEVAEEVAARLSNFVNDKEILVFHTRPDYRGEKQKPIVFRWSYESNCLVYDPAFYSVPM